MCGSELALAVLRSDGVWPQGYAKHNSQLCKTNVLLKRRVHVSIQRFRVHSSEKISDSGVVSC
jgi:hypothetical protein